MSQGGTPTIEDLTATIRSIPDFPKPGILFRDITPLLANGPAFRAAVDAMAASFERVDHVVSIESRGFIFGAPIAYKLGAGLVPVRKVGRLPGNTLQEEYELEYGVIPSRSTVTRSRRDSASSSSTICWQPAGRFARR
jgi:adenine phosphoribosyltransferase